MRRWIELDILSLSLSELRALVSFGYHFSVVAVSTLLVAFGLGFDVQPLVDAGVFLALAHGLTFRRLPVAGWVQERFIHSWRCRDCSTEIALTGRWRCPSCSFVSSPRHVFSSCPGGCAGKRAFAWIVCPGCGTGIPL